MLGLVYAAAMVAGFGLTLLSKRRAASGPTATSGAPPLNSPGAPTYSDVSGWTNPDGTTAPPAQVFASSLAEQKQTVAAALEIRDTSYLRQLEAYYRATAAEYIAKATVGSGGGTYQPTGDGQWTLVGASTYTHQESIDYANQLLKLADEIAAQIVAIEAANAAAHVSNVSNEKARLEALGYTNVRYADGYWQYTLPAAPIPTGGGTSAPAPVSVAQSLSGESGTLAPGVIPGFTDLGIAPPPGVGTVSTAPSPTSSTGVPAPQPTSSGYLVGNITIEQAATALLNPVSP